MNRAPMSSWRVAYKARLSRMSVTRLIEALEDIEIIEEGDEMVISEAIERILKLGDLDDES